MAYSFDPKSIFEAYRQAFAPVVKAQQEGVKAIDRAAHYQYAVAGDYLEWSLAQANATLGVQNPTEFISKQVELANAFGGKMRTRLQEFVTIANETAAKVAEVTQAEVTRATEAVTKKAA